jgi:nitrite reductase (NADH) small subunit
MNHSERPSTIHVGAVSEFQNGDRRLVRYGATAIGIFRVGDDFVAYENLCPHQGGPVCEGRYFPLIEMKTTDDGRVTGEMHNKSKPNLVCPWHGWEYDLRTGEFSGNRNIRLRKFDVRIEEGQVYVAI